MTLSGEDDPVGRRLQALLWVETNQPKAELGSLRFHCGLRTAIFSAMSVILKDEKFVAVEAAVRASFAPQPVAAAFSELSAMRAESKKLDEPEGYYLKAMNCLHYRSFGASNLFGSN